MHVKTKTRIRRGIAIVVAGVLCVLAYENWERILPAIGQGAEAVYDATHDLGK